MGDFRLPTDAEISVMVGGIPVTSNRPEDFPHFKPSIYEGYNAREFDVRHRAVITNFFDFSPAVMADPALESIAHVWADTRSAQVTTFRFSGSDKPDFFALLRPSEVIEPHEKKANEFGLKANQVEKVIPLADMNFISTYHEIGHMIAAAQGIKFDTDFDEELYADKHGLNKYLEKGGSLRVVRDYINSRALAGFLNQPYQYWLAQHLNDEFFNDGSGKKTDRISAFLANDELRLRVIDRMAGDGSMADYKSADIHKAMELANRDLEYTIQDPKLKRAVTLWLNNREQIHIHGSQQMPDIFSAVGEIIDNPNVDPATKKLAGMVVDGARSFTPSLVPQHMRVATPAKDAIRVTSNQDTVKPAKTPLVLMDIPYDTMAWDDKQNKFNYSSGKSQIIDYAHRKIVVVDMGGVAMPYYLSSGEGGKADVPAGKWYPILGIGSDGWINKSGSRMTGYYGSERLKEVALELDRTIGDVRDRPDIPKAKATGAHLGFINQDMTPIDNETHDVRERFDENLRRTLARIDPSAVPVKPPVPISNHPEPTAAHEPPKVIAAAAAKVEPDHAPADKPAPIPSSPAATANVAGEPNLPRPETANPFTADKRIGTIELSKATHSRMSLGAGSAGTGMAVVGLHNAIQKGDTIGTSISGLDLAVSATDVTMDGLSAAGRTISKAARKMITKANVAVVLIDGTYQISQEEGAFNKAARGGAVATTAMTGFGIGGLAATVTTTGLAASAATVAAPLAATVAVAITADAAVDAFKATGSLNDAIKAQEKGAKTGSAVGEDGAPSISNYKKLSWFAKTEGTSPDGSKGDSRQVIAAKVSQFSYATSPAALDELEKGLKAKIAGYDKVIKDNDSWVHDSVRFFWAGDKIDTQRTAKIERTSYVAALNELKLYRQEIAEHKLKPPVTVTPAPKVDPPVQSTPPASAKAAFKQVKDVPIVRVDPLAPSVDDMASLPAQYVVQNGDALSSIVSNHYQNTGVLKNYKSIQAATEAVAKLNGIENIHKIQAEQIIKLPAADQLAKLIKDHEVNTSQWFAPRTPSLTRDTHKPR